MHSAATQGVIYAPAAPGSLLLVREEWEGALGPSGQRDSGWRPGAQTSQARPQASPPAHLVPRAPHPYTGTVHRTQVGVFCFLTSTLGGTPELVMRKFQECWALPVLGSWPGTSKVASLWGGRCRARQPGLLPTPVHGSQT